MLVFILYSNLKFLYIFFEEEVGSKILFDGVFKLLFRFLLKLFRSFFKCFGSSFFFNCIFIYVNYRVKWDKLIVVCLIIKIEECIG